MASTYLFAVKLLGVYVVGIWFLDLLIRKYAVYTLRLRDREELKRELLANGSVTREQLDRILSKKTWEQFIRDHVSSFHTQHVLRKRILKYFVGLWAGTFVLFAVPLQSSGTTSSTGVLAGLWPITGAVALAAWLPIEIVALGFVAVFLDFVLRREGFAR